jgi:hypothetical protein
MHIGADNEPDAGNKRGYDAYVTSGTNDSQKENEDGKETQTNGKAKEQRYGRTV